MIESTPNFILYYADFSKLVTSKKLTDSNYYITVCLQKTGLTNHL